MEPPGSGLTGEGGGKGGDKGGGNCDMQMVDSASIAGTRHTQHSTRASGCPDARSPHNSANSANYSGAMASPQGEENKETVIKPSAQPCTSTAPARHRVPQGTV